MSSRWNYGKKIFFWGGRDFLIFMAQRLYFSHLNEYKFIHNFNDTASLMRHCLLLCSACWELLHLIWVLCLALSSSYFFIFIHLFFFIIIGIFHITQPRCTKLWKIKRNFISSARCHRDEPHNSELLLISSTLLVVKAENIYIRTQPKNTKLWKQSSVIKQLLEALVLTIKLSTGFTANVTWSAIFC